MAETPKMFPGTASHTDWGDAAAGGNLQVFDFSIKFESDSGVVEMPLEGLLIQCGAGKNATVQFTHPQNPDWSLCANSTDILKQWQFQKQFNLRRQILQIEERRDDRKRLKATVCFLVGFFAISFLLMNLTGWILNCVVARIPLEYEAKIGADVSKQLEKHLHFVTTSNVTNALKADIITLLTPASPLKYDPQVFVYTSGTPNAFVVPGGYYYVSTALLSLAKTPEEIAGVLAHESAHVKCRHGIRGMIARQGHSFLFRWIFGDQHNLLSVISAGSDLLVNQTYSRELELQADEQGRQMLLAANIDPRGEIEILKKLDAFENPAGKKNIEEISVLRSHPQTQERIHRLMEKWEKCPQKSGFITLEKIDWKEDPSPLNKLLNILN